MYVCVHISNFLKSGHTNIFALFDYFELQINPTILASRNLDKYSELSDFSYMNFKSKKKFDHETIIFVYFVGYTFQYGNFSYLVDIIR